jgi:hypothetical protein
MAAEYTVSEYTLAHAPIYSYHVMGWRPEMQPRISLHQASKILWSSLDSDAIDDPGRLEYFKTGPEENATVVGMPVRTAFDFRDGYDRRGRKCR